MKMNVILKCLPLLVPGGILIAGLGIAWATEIADTCNRLEMGSEIDVCWGEWRDDLPCSTKSEAECSGQGAETLPVPDPESEYYKDCSDTEGDQYAHCVEDTDTVECLRKFNCVWDPTAQTSVKCGVGAAVDPEAYWEQTQATSPSCVPGS